MAARASRHASGSRDLLLLKNTIASSRPGRESRKKTVCDRGATDKINERVGWVEREWKRERAEVDGWMDWKEWDAGAEEDCW